MKTRTKFVGASVVALLAVGAYAVSASSAETGMTFMQGMMGHAMTGPGMMGTGLMGQGRMGPGMMGQGMTGFAGMGMHAPGAAGHEGVTATGEEMDGIHQLFANYDQITRQVTNLPNGIRTVTESNDPATAQIIKDHVAGMTQRIADGRDPGLPIESAELRALFQNGEKIATKIEVTDKGMAVTQTSEDAKTVALLQTHAEQVTGFVKEGMSALHNAMAKNGAMPAGIMNGDMHEMMMKGAMGHR